MTSASDRAVIRHFVDEMNRGNLDVIDETVLEDFYSYKPSSGEETQSQVLRQLAGDIHGALPDLKMEVNNFNDSGDTLSFDLKLSGTHTGSLWGAPASGKPVTWESRVTSRHENSRFAICWENLSLPDVMGVLRAINLVPAPEDMDKPTKYPVSVPDFILKVLYTGQVAYRECSHLETIKITEPTTDVCHDCESLGDIWPALRMCLVCGYVGCCDTSKNKHMKQHSEETGHQIFRSIRLDESWVWCYEDNAFFYGEILDQYSQQPIS